MDNYVIKPVQHEDLRRVLRSPGADDDASARSSGDTTGCAETPVDWQIIEHLLASLQMPRGEAATLLHDMYECELPAQLAALTVAVAAEDRRQVARLAHKLRGGSRQLGALKLASACADLEAAAKDPSAPALGGPNTRVRTSYAETWDWLQRRLRAIIEGG